MLWACESKVLVERGDGRRLAVRDHPDGSLGNAKVGGHLAASGVIGVEPGRGRKEIFGLDAVGDLQPDLLEPVLIAEIRERRIDVARGCRDGDEWIGHVSRELPARTGWKRRDVVDDVNAFAHAPEDRIAGAGLRAVEPLVVRKIDEELRRRRVWIVRPRRCERAPEIADPVHGLVRHRIDGRLTPQISVVTASLDHEIGNDAVKHGPGVVALVHVVEEILHMSGRLLVEELHDEPALVRTEDDVCGVRGCREARGQRNREQSGGNSEIAAHRGPSTMVFTVASSPVSGQWFHGRIFARLAPGVTALDRRLGSPERRRQEYCASVNLVSRSRNMNSA